MEKVKITRNSPKYDFRVGDTYGVLRNVMGECVVIMGNVPNVIMSERKLKSYGTLTGKPQMG